MRHSWIAGSVALIALAGSVSLLARGLEKASIGSTAPAFTLADQNGKNVSLSDYTGKVVVLEWFNENCPFVKRVYKSGEMNDTANKYAGQGVVWLGINSSKDATNDSNKEAAAKLSIQHPILNDSAGTVGHAYGATNTPDMYIIDKDGKLVYSGAIDNDPEGTKDSTSRVNYVSKALDEILADKPVSEPQTKPYGCNVHYAQ